jgi:dinuclear metal center YbgI/SA1388 family protein
MAPLRTIVKFLDRHLKIADYDDTSNNGLQVENSGTVRRVCCGVDASMAFFRKAAKRHADLLVVHHGISWSDSLKRITRANYRWVSFLVGRDIALYACHIPLDAHPRLGNNAKLCSALGLRSRRRYGDYHGKDISFYGDLPRAMGLEPFRKRVAKVVGNRVECLAFGKGRVKRVAVLSGGGAGWIEQAAAVRADVFLTGEGSLAACNLAQDIGMNVLLAGHYATESFGVKAVTALLKRRFGVEAEFVDLKIKY